MPTPDDRAALARWTHSDIVTLRERVRQGHEEAQIANGLGRTIKEVAHMAARLRLGRASFPLND